MKTQTLFHPPIFKENQAKNASSKTSLRQKMFKGAVMIIILLQTACAMNAAVLRDDPNDWSAPNRTKLASSGSGASLTCSTDMLEKDLTRPKVQANVPGFSRLPKAQSRAQNDARSGARVVLMLRNQQEIAGRLLSVRENALVLSKNEAQGKRIEAQIADVLVVGVQDILRARFKDNAKFQKGAVIGFLIGAGAGAIIGFAFGDDPPCSNSGGDCAFAIGPSCIRFTAEGKAVLGGILGGAVGAIVGGNASAAVSFPNKEGASTMNYDFSALKPLAQFPMKEPECLCTVK